MNLMTVVRGAFLFMMLLGGAALHAEQNSTLENVDQISLKHLQQAADAGDRLSMQLLAAAYEEGSYGLAPNHEEALKWTSRATVTPQNYQHRLDLDHEPWEQIPHKPIVLAQLAGATFIGVGGYLLKTYSKN